LDADEQVPAVPLSHRHTTPNLSAKPLVKHIPPSRPLSSGFHARPNLWFAAPTRERWPDAP